MQHAVEGLEAPGVQPGRLPGHLQRAFEILAQEDAGRPAVMSRGRAGRCCGRPARWARIRRPPPGRRTRPAGRAASRGSCAAIRSAWASRSSRSARSIHTPCRQQAPLHSPSRQRCIASLRSRRGLSVRELGIMGGSNFSINAGGKKSRGRITQVLPYRSISGKDGRVCSPEIYPRRKVLDLGPNKNLLESRRPKRLCKVKSRQGGRSLDSIILHEGAA